jgi:hypothetical protein
MVSILDISGIKRFDSRPKEDKRTCTLAVHNDVMPPILDPDTPGGFRANMDWSKFSSSATAEDMLKELTFFFGT